MLTTAVTPAATASPVSNSGSFSGGASFSHSSTLLNASNSTSVDHRVPSIASASSAASLVSQGFGAVPLADAVASSSIATTSSNSSRSDDPSSRYTSLQASTQDRSAVSKRVRQLLRDIFFRDTGKLIRSLSAVTEPLFACVVGLKTVPYSTFNTPKAQWVVLGLEFPLRPIEQLSGPQLHRIVESQHSISFVPCRGVYVCCVVVCVCCVVLCVCCVVLCGVCVCVCVCVCVWWCVCVVCVCVCGV